MFLPLTAQKGEILKNVSMMAFLDMDMKHKIIHSINMPELDENHHLRTFKVTYLITIGMLSYKTGCSCLSCMVISDNVSKKALNKMLSYCHLVPHAVPKIYKESIK
jgi:hypothetical protein